MLRRALPVLALAGLLAASLTLTACDAATEAGSAPAGYVDGALKTKKKAEKLVEEINAKQYIDLFKVEHGRAPKDIEELKRSLGDLPLPPAGKEWKLEGEKLVAVDVTGVGD